MKLRKVLKHIDFLTWIKIFIEEDDEQDEPAWEGTAWDCPWVYGDMKLSTNENGEAISVAQPHYNKNNVKYNCLHIWVTENED